MPRQMAKYMRKYRAAHPEYVKEQARQNRARKRALSRLATRHPVEFSNLYAAELAKEPAQTTRV